ncbi:MAG: chromosome partitioning protein ParB, partial [Pseudorhodoplanes sp.]
VKAFIIAGKFSAGHARALLGQDNPVSAAREIVEQGLNVRQAEALKREGPQSKPRPGKPTVRVKDADTAAVEKRLSDALGLVVEIDDHEKGGMVRIKYRNLDQLDEVIRRLERNA